MKYPKERDNAEQKVGILRRHLVRGVPISDRVTSCTPHRCCYTPPEGILVKLPAVGCPPDLRV